MIPPSNAKRRRRANPAPHTDIKFRETLTADVGVGRTEEGRPNGSHREAEDPSQQLDTRLVMEGLQGLQKLDGPGKLQTLLPLTASVNIRNQTLYSRTWLSGTSNEQADSPAQSKIPLIHRDLYGGRVRKARIGVPLRAKSRLKRSR
jgi:hypothetical protein